MRVLISRLMLLFGLLFVPGMPLGAENSFDLQGEQWLLSFTNSRQNASADLDDSRWQKVRQPGDLMHQPFWQKRKNDIVWLRYHLHLGSIPDENLSLVLGRVYDHDEVYVNGQLIGRSPLHPRLAVHYGRPRLYPVPDRLWRTGDNVISIRLKTSFKNKIGIVSAPIQILSTAAASRLLYQKELDRLVFTGLYLAAGFFFLVLYRQLHQFKEYKWFGIFALLFGSYQFLTNDLRFQLFDGFLVYKYLEQVCYLLLPSVYFHFIVYFFKFEKLPGLSVSPRRAAFFYAIFNGVFVVLFLVLFNPVTWDRIITWWFPSVLLVAIYITILIALKAWREWNRDAIFALAGTLILIWQAIQFNAIQRGYWDGQAWFNEALFIFFFALTLALIFRLIEMQLEVNSRRNRLQSVDTMQDRIFSYINIFLQKPAEQVVSLKQRLESAQIQNTARIAILQEMESQVRSIESRLDDILELSRLEVINEPEFLEPVNFYDFISAVIPSDKITHYIKVNPDLLLNTSLELVNSFVVRVIDFPAFREFPNIDLIITSDLSGKIHFRFMLFHTNVRKTRQLRELLTEMNPERGELWTKWAIIREIIRILHGDLEVRIINRKFLSIDIHLSAEKPIGRPGSSGARESSAVQLFITESNNLESTAAAAPTSPAIKPRLHAKMTITEFVQFLKSRLKR
ncbi:MAG: hypothetical protein KDK39_04845 [Leptospiraceae bacterium]|nr:hypothetical protein [Leptospiraceae bacterium]